MGLLKCPRCELNYMRDTERYCDVCRKEMKGEVTEQEEMNNLCAECGENEAIKGQDYCAYCLNELRRREKLDKMMEQPAQIEMDMAQLDEIDVPNVAGIPSEDLQEIHKEFGDDEDLDGEEEDAEEIDDFFESLEDLDDDLDDEE